MCGGRRVKRKNEKQKFLSFPAGVFQIPEATAPRACERSKRVGRGWGKGGVRQKEEKHILEATRHLRIE